MEGLRCVWGVLVYGCEKITGIGLLLSWMFFIYWIVFFLWFLCSLHLRFLVSTLWSKLVEFLEWLTNRRSWWNRCYVSKEPEQTSFFLTLLVRQQQFCVGWSEGTPKLCYKPRVQKDTPETCNFCQLIKLSIVQLEYVIVVTLILAVNWCIGHLSLCLLSNFCVSL